MKMQCFAWADAMLCGNGCNALRESWAELAQKYHNNQHALTAK